MKRRYKVLSVVLGLLLATWATLALLLSHDSPCRSAPPLPAGAQAMKAVVYRCYGPPDVVRLEEIAKPAPADNQVLVKVHAASVNPLDWHYLLGVPYVMRALGAGIGSPADIRLGVDFAGTVEAVGRTVTRFKPGDAVFGGADGAFAEYVTVRENGSVALKPSSVPFEQAAAVPVAAITALQALRDKGKVHAGQRVLINGASGGVGTFAVQIAKSFGANVTGVCSSRNVAMVRAIGADRVIDYTREDFTTSPEHYDLILDLVGNRPLLETRRVLKPGGMYLGVGGGGPEDQGFVGPLWGPIKEMLLSKLVSQKFVMFFADLNQGDLATLADLMQAGTIKPVIDRSYTLADTAEALRYLERGHARGKVVITLD